MKCTRCGRRSPTSVINFSAADQGWTRELDDRDVQYCPACTPADRATTVALQTVEWVAGHGESHGQILVTQCRGPRDVLVRLAEGFTPAAHGIAGPVRIVAIHFDWWSATPCQHGQPGTGHPRWHYHRTSRNRPAAFRAAEVRIGIRPRSRRGVPC